MHAIICFPFLDLRFLTEPSLAPKKPGWPRGTFGTVGSLGRVVAAEAGNAEGEVRANAAILFPSEYSRGQKARRRLWQDNPAVADIATVSARRILADTNGQVRLEITLDLGDALPEDLSERLDSLLRTPVRVVREGDKELFAAGFSFAQLYLNESAKTAERSDQELMQVLVREGSGSPFVVVLWNDAAPSSAVQFTVSLGWISLGVSFSVLDLPEQQLAVWQIWNVPPRPSSLTCARTLCRTVGYLSEVTLLTGLLDPEAMKPYALSIPAVEAFFRLRAGQLRRKQIDGWPVMDVLRQATRRLRVSIGSDAELRTSLGPVRRDVAGEVIAILGRIDEAARAAPETPTVSTPMPTTRPEMKDDDRDRLVDVLKRAAENSDDSEAYFRRLLRQAKLPDDFRSQRYPLVKGRADAVARDLVTWALDQGTNPEDRRYSTLGALLAPELKGLGVENAIAVASIIYFYRLFADQRLLDDLRVRFQLPERRTGEAGAAEIGPEFVWHGPQEAVTLQAWLRPEPALLDVGLIISAAERSRSVCQITVGATGATGTGVLVGDDLILTNHHVLSPDGGRDPAQQAGSVRLNFGNYTGSATNGRVQCALDPGNPVIEWSPTHELDFVLMRAADTIRQAAALQAAPIETGLPQEKSPLNILQHPNGETMKLGISDDAVTYVSGESGIVQYVTRALSGSSGSPCFDEKWNMVALHHAERARSFGRVREGILMRAIHPRIARHLEL